MDEKNKLTIEIENGKSCLIVSADGIFEGGHISEEDKMGMMNRGAVTVAALFVLQRDEKYRDEFNALVSRLVDEVFLDKSKKLN